MPPAQLFEDAMTQQITYDQIEPGNLTPFRTTPRTPGEWQAFLNTLDAAKVEQEEKPE